MCILIELGKCFTLSLLLTYLDSHSTKERLPKMGGARGSYESVALKCKYRSTIERQDQEWYRNAPGLQATPTLITKVKSVIMRTNYVALIGLSRNGHWMTNISEAMPGYPSLKHDRVSLSD